MIRFLFAISTLTLFALLWIEVGQQAPPVALSFPPENNPVVELSAKERFGRAVTDALDANKLVLIFVSGVSCTPCREFENNVWSSGVFQSTIEDRFVPLKLQLDEPWPGMETVAKAMNVKVVPFVFIFDPVQSRVVGKGTPATSVIDFQSQLEELCSE